MAFFFVSLLAAVAAKTCSGASLDNIGAYIDSAGVLKLFGNSFGRPGYNDTYDYIVIGGGNAGATIAARLALDPANYSVAVVEAGNFYEFMDGNRTQVPGYNYINTIEFPLGKQTPPTLWSLDTLPQAGFGGRTESYTTGQALGGRQEVDTHTAANYMGYQRGTEGSFNQWAEIVGDDYWKWPNVYNAYKKSVTFQPPDYSKIGHGFNISYDPSAFDQNGGPLHVSYGNFMGAYGPSLNDALQASGLDLIDGFNSGKLIGYGTATATIDIRTATRDTSESSFLQLAASQTNIKIYPQALAEKILFDGRKKATGVQVQSNIAMGNLKYTLTARKEVILSAGVWHSPQLLMLSGVGPAETLRQHGIDVVADLPGVGQSEFDQPVVGIFLNLTEATNTQFQAGNPGVVAAAIEEYLDHQSGPLSGFGTGEGIAFEKFPKAYRANFSNATLEYLATFPDDFPEIEILGLANVPVQEVPITPGDNFIIFSAVLLTPKSRGNMTIASNSIFDEPLISPNWLENPVDVEMAYAALLRLREIKSKWSAVSGELLPGASVTSKENLLAYITEHSGFIYHGTSTCKMGRSNDTLAVVDSRARVYGVTGLRVVDTSAFPNCPPGHPMSSTYMFAEMIAESILSGK